MYIETKEIKWSEEKAEILLRTRGIDLNKIKELIRQGRFQMEMVPNQEAHEGQRMYVVALDGYVCCVPFVETDRGEIFIKTAFQSRVFQKKYKDLLK